MPESQLTRSEFATLIARAANLPVSEVGTDFTDVPGSHWANKFITAVKKTEYMIGIGESKFNPDANVSRAEAIKAISNIHRKNVDEDEIRKAALLFDLNEFDLVGHWAYADIMEAAYTHDYELVETENGMIEIWTNVIKDTALK
jgi:hypothetical protein